MWISINESMKLKILDRESFVEIPFSMELCLE